MVTCWTDISFPLIELSQYKDNPAKGHYEALKHISHYIKSTKIEGIHYWRSTPHINLPDLPLSQPKQSTYDTTHVTNDDHPAHVHGGVDYD